MFQNQEPFFTSVPDTTLGLSLQSFWFRLLGGSQPFQGDSDPRASTKCLILLEAGPQQNKFQESQGGFCVLYCISNA